MSKNRFNGKIFVQGIRDSIPIGLGYMAVSFSLGMMARKIGLTPLQGFISSFLNHASAGEYAEFTVIGSDAAYWEMALIIFVTNIRYSLMSLAYSQRFSKDTNLLNRIIMSFGISDEIFGINIARGGELSPSYTYGVMTFAILCWSVGTPIGITVGNILPSNVVAALSVALYGMFVAIIVPPAKKDKIVGLFIVISFIASYVATKLPYLSSITEGMRVIIVTIVVTIIAAVLFPRKEEETKSDT